ncbi:UDP-N-acetylmuramate--L-alanine ligase [Humidisolicoccus flavus]|uniref:UDP-N-acetylmuramate--L-alanine ligase n=1 Tax=Humidisolicoccus flavus TaxID=3111414 RepID=UPI00324633A2
MITPDLSTPIPARIESVHFIGIGGSGMSGIAVMMIDAGIRVSGSDRSDSATTQMLREHGAQVAIGHDAVNLGQVDAVVVTSALWPENPELLEAQKRGITVLHRSQALAYLAQDRRVLAVAGAHGKTTSTGMLVVALRALGADPSFVNGGVVHGIGASSGHGSGELFVLEADESDGSFALYDTKIALILNIDTDHLDHYGSHENFDRAFIDFANSADDLVVISADDEGAKRVHAQLEHPNVLTFGESSDADVRISNITVGTSVSFDLDYQGGRYSSSVQTVGRHNALNAAAVFTVLVGAGFEPGEVAASLTGFSGTGRRFEPHGARRGVRVYDDYAHHPAEVVAALTAARTVLGEGRLIAVHQPHLYSRTRDMAAEFAAAYESLADHTVILDVYGAREDPIPGVTGELVYKEFSDRSKADFLADWQEAADRVGEIAKDGDLVMTLSCGDVYRIIPQLLTSLEGTTDAS